MWLLCPPPPNEPEQSQTHIQEHIYVYQRTDALPIQIPEDSILNPSVSHFSRLSFLAWGVTLACISFVYCFADALVELPLQGERAGYL